MRREATAAALSLGLLLAVPGVEVPRRAARAGLPALRAETVLPIPPEDPSVVLDGSGLSAWSAPAGARAVAPYAVASRVIAAYVRAVAASPPECHLSVSLLAAVGQVESGNLAGRRLDAGNRVRPAILGPVLDGRHTRAVADTDAGRWDGDRRWDRALGPLQFIPSSWREVAVDLDRDGVRDPQDLDDAAGAAMLYLCAGGRDLATEEGLRAAILSYNHSTEYLGLVLAWKAAFDSVDLAGWGAAPLYEAWQVAKAVSLPAAGPTTTPRPPHPAPVHDGAVMSAGAAPLVTTPPETTPEPEPLVPPGEPGPVDPTGAGEDPKAEPPESCLAPPPSPVVPVPTDPTEPATVPEPDPTPAPTAVPTVLPSTEPPAPDQIPACTPDPVPETAPPAPAPGPDPVTAPEPLARPVG